MGFVGNDPGWVGPPHSVCLVSCYQRTIRHLWARLLLHEGDNFLCRSSVISFLAVFVAGFPLGLLKSQHVG